MIGFTKIRKLMTDQRGVVAAMIAISLTALVGLTSAAIDLGMVYNARSELQNAADAAALAAANTMVTQSAGVTTATPGEALQTAKTLSLANQSLNKPLSLLDQDFTIGFWDEDAGAFDASRMGFSSDPSDLTAVRVTLRRDDLANSPVSTFFAGIFGIDTVDVSATATAFLGFPGEVPGDTVDLPIAILEDKIVDGDGPNCGEVLSFHSESGETAEWTTFFKWPTNSPTVDGYVCDCWDTPELKIGDDINVVNGNLSNNVFSHLKQRFDRSKVGGEWTVTLPVVSSGSSSTVSTIVGFMKFTITEVQRAPHKNVTGYLQCGEVVSGSSSGGTDYGSRAANSVLIR